VEPPGAEGLKNLVAGCKSSLMAKLGRLPLRPVVPVDFSSLDSPARCRWCGDAWYYEWSTDGHGERILREWHQQGCAVVTDWEETDPEALEQPV
jgi:hypothetical protein